MRQVAILGATGSIGGSALDVIRRHPDRFRASVLSANSDVAGLVELCRQHRPLEAIIADRSLLPELRQGLRAAGLDTRPSAGRDALDAAAAGDYSDTVIAAIVGAAGLTSTLAAARAGKRLLLANKEAIVVAGELLMQAVADSGATLLPIDSEHSALFQCLPHPALGAAARPGVRRLTLTASGGPFRGRSRAELVAVTPDQACAHPTWNMGRKISVDSATLMNKGLEVIEAHWLFGAPADAIQVVVHPQSIVHALVEFVDGSTLAQLGPPDMRSALAAGLAWPDRVESGVGSLDLVAVGQLQFEAPDRDAFPCLDLAYRCLEAGPAASTVLNAANEVAVSAFLQGKLGFLGIPRLIGHCLDTLAGAPAGSLDALLALDARTRDFATRAIPALSGLAPGGAGQPQTRQD